MSTFSPLQTMRPVAGDVVRPNMSSTRPSPRSITRTALAHYIKRPILQIGPIVFATLVCATIFVAWIERDEGHLTAESGIGYWLGIVGAVIMLMLVGYPIRKRFRFLSSFGRVANWFRMHMVLGIVGPTLVILHTNFKLGSLNSRLALVTMLIVVASGIAGRYLYAKIHKGLYGKHLELREVLNDITNLKIGIEGNFANHPGILAELERYSAKSREHATLLGGFASAALAGTKSRTSRRRILRFAKDTLRTDKSARGVSRRQRRSLLNELSQQLRIFFAAVKKAERLAFFERVFGMWHHLHMPLFVLLVLTVLMHVIAVHLY